MRMKRIGKHYGRRWLSTMMAVICFCMSFLTSVHTTTVVSHAATFQGRNIWTGGPEVINGRSRNYLYRWTDGWQMTFCIMPGNHMGSTVTAGAIRTNVDDADIPYIESREDYERLAMVCSWYDANGSVSADNATYAAAQTAVWAIIGDGWESGDSLAQLVDRHIKGTYDRWITLKEYVEDDGADGSGLPGWCSVSSVSGDPQPMLLKDGHWYVELDVSDNPKMAFLNWVFEGDSTGWSKSVRDGKIRFTYSGNKNSDMLVSAVLPEEMKSLAKNTTSLNLYIPNGDPEKVQAMISAGPYEGRIYVKLAFSGSGSAESGDGGMLDADVEIYRHTEVFSAHYNLELEKYCSETGQPLEGALFQIQEAFDDSQVNGKLDAGCMTPMPVSWKGFQVCSEALTDHTGYFLHTDKKEYEYTKTYCDGHPEPEYLEVPEPSFTEEGEVDNADEIAAVEEANALAREQWEALIQACAENTDFHSEEPGEGLEMMLDDREETYQSFIHLKYDYMVEEIQARYGYIRHGLHPEDEELPVVRIASAEAGNSYELIGGVEDAVKISGHRQLHQIATATPATPSDADIIVVEPEEASPSEAKPLPGEQLPQKESFRYEPDRSKISAWPMSEWDMEASDTVLPLPQQDTVDWIEQSGDSACIGYAYQVYNHRTEGEYHLQKKDLELPAGVTQGDAVLEGAVYGLFAAEDIVHPDGKSGVIFQEGELVSEAVTDSEGNVSFFSYTQQSQTMPDIEWKGRPLILGQYYVKEIARSIGYELSVRGKDQEVTNLHTREAPVIVNGQAEVVTAMTHPVDMHDGSWLEFDVRFQDTDQGFDVVVSGYPETSCFYLSRIDETAVMEQVVTGTKLVFTGKYEQAEAGEYKLDKEGNYIPVTDSEGNILKDTSLPVSRTYYAVPRLRYYPAGAAIPEVDPEKWEDTEQADLSYVQAETNQMLEQIGYQMLDPEHGEGAPWTVIPLSGYTNQELIQELLDWFSEHSFWDSAAVHEVWMEEGEYKAAVFHDYARLSETCIYDQDTEMIYIKQNIDVEEMGLRHMYISYAASETEHKGQYITINQVKTVVEPISFLDDLEAKLEPAYAPLYQRYEEGEYRLDGDGNRIPIYRTEFVYEEKEEVHSDYVLTPLHAAYEKETGNHRIHIDNVIDWNQTREPVTMTIRAVADGMEVADAGSEEFYSDYLTDVQGVGASAFLQAKLPEDAYVKMIRLTYPGQVSVIQDGIGIPGQGSLKTPLEVNERVIKQKVKVMKSVQKLQEGMEGLTPIENFRFKAYLKSNLEFLYCDEDGSVTWIDRHGDPIDIGSYCKEAQTLVPVIRTKGEHDSTYRRILECLRTNPEGEGKPETQTAYNYEKFFHAIRVANHDKWDDWNPTYTSYRPVGNRWNHTDYTLKNVQVSDQVRQFAIDWYLDEEVKLLTKEFEAALPEKVELQDEEEHLDYGDELYDEALFNALEKADDYLRPFFRYDLDTIYSIEWEADEAGGCDLDSTTVHADMWAEDHCFGVSAYLPYGTYIVVEQQPQYATLKDYPNKHYKIDVPKEVIVPAIYTDYESFLQSPPGWSDFYRYDETMTEEEMEKRYWIRLGQEKFEDGAYTAALVPWSLVEPKDEEEDMQPLPTAESTYLGYAGVRFRNVWYRTGLRIEKLDTETYENILHDEAVFSIYKAKCDTSEYGDGEVIFYEEDTMISGSRGFLESIGATQITPMYRDSWRYLGDTVISGPGSLYTGIVPAGMPVFEEEDKVIMTDTDGTEIKEFTCFTTMRKGGMEDAKNPGSSVDGRQNVGYLETPGLLEAGVYVLVENKAPAGYVRMKPMAVEIYSDKITYYQDGDDDKPILAEIYESDKEGSHRELQDQAVLFATNKPTKLLVEKVKEASEKQAYTTKDKTVSWKVSGRIEGTLAQIGENPDYEYAYVNGDYQGYAWRKGTLEYLKALKDAGKQVELAYDGQLFAGYGYITETLKTAEDDNPYVAGAQMTLYEAAELFPSGDNEDYFYENLNIERNLNQEVSRMFLDDGRDILYYDLRNLQVFEYGWINGQQKLYGYDRDRQKVLIEQLEQERRNYQKTDRESSIYVFRDNMPYLELAGGDLTSISYSALNHCFTGDFARIVRDRHGNYRFTEGLKMYHLDKEGNRDSFVDPQTGMAYVLEESAGSAEEKTKRILVWPVKVYRDDYGNVIARDKISTFRIATIGEYETAETVDPYQEAGYIVGTWRDRMSLCSHKLSTIEKNRYGQNMNGEPMMTDHVGMLEKHVNPVLDRHGRVIYYQRESSTYQEAAVLYDRDGEAVRNKSADLLKKYNLAGYFVQGTPIYHRQGEHYILENTWVTGEVAPNDPFHTAMTEGQGDLLKRVPVGTYILEEVTAPEGYVKGLPRGIIVEETDSVQMIQMVDYTTKLMIGKVDGTEHHTYQILDMLNADDHGVVPVLGYQSEGKSAYGYEPLSGARLRLSSKDGSWSQSWTSNRGYWYMEGIPEGEYVLEELQIPEGFVSKGHIPVQVSNTREVQNFLVYNDHTKLEIEKYTLNDGERILVNHAGFTLYQAQTDEEGNPLYKGGKVQYEETQPVISWESCDGEKYKGFIPAFEEMYRDHGITGEIVSWEEGKVHYTAILEKLECIDASVEGGTESMHPTTAVMLYRMEDGKHIRVTAYQQQDNRWGKDFCFEYQFEYQKLENVNPYAVSYVTMDGMRRLEYLPVGNNYVLVETGVPEGFAKSEDILIAVKDMAHIQRYSILNQESMLMISKVSEQSGQELAGAHLALYRAGEQEELVIDEEHLAAAWESGTDGRYTELDKINQKIPEGYQVGDLRPHTLRRLPDGIYYLVEQQAPDYYMVMKPEKIVYEQDDEIRLIRVADQVVQGELLIRKTDEEQQPLEGAAFLVAAYLGEEQVFARQYSEHGGELQIKDLPVGAVREDGSVDPYRYEITEIIPPDGYAVTTETISFEFAEGSYEHQSLARKTVTVINEKTRIMIQKGILESMQVDARPVYVQGAGLAVYHVTGRDEHGEYMYCSEAPVAEWITSELEPTMELVGVIAGQTYLLVEKNVPSGLRMMNPIAFTISRDGRGIEYVYGDMDIISVQYAGTEVDSVTVRGRSGIGVEMSVKNQLGKEIARWIADGNRHGIRRSDDVRDGEVCVITETAVYSDGSREMIGRTVRALHYVDDVVWISDHKLDKVLLELLDEHGVCIERCEFWTEGNKNNTFEWIIGNGLDDSGNMHRFESGKKYQLVETSFFSDGTRYVSGRLGFALDGSTEIDLLTVFDKAYHVWISKQEITGTEEIAGARLQIQDMQGSVIEEWISEEKPHEIKANLVPGKSYILHEDTAPDGWGYASDIIFTVSENGMKETVVMIDKPTHVRVRKTDITGETEVPGAILQILDEEGLVIEEWVSGTQPHDIVGILKAGGEYCLHEEYAPNGYAYAEDVRFVVSMDGTIDPVIMKDEKKPVHSQGEEEPEIEEIPEPEEPGRVPEATDVPKEPGISGKEESEGTRIGRITAVYKRRLSVHERDSFGGFSGMILPKLGDDMGAGSVIAMLFFGMLALTFSVIWQRGRKSDDKFKKRKRGRYLSFLLLVGVLVVKISDEGYASETVQTFVDHQSESGLIVTFDPFTLECRSPICPPREYQYEGQKYYLHSSQLVSACIEETEIYAEELVTYESVEQADEIPQTIMIEAEDKNTGVSVKAEVSAQTTTFDNWRWIPGFEFIITVQQYDLGQFYLGDRIVTEGEGALFAGYEEALLELIGVNPQYYQIENMEWIADAWVGDGGLVYRQAKASGQKYVADCSILYGGDVKLPKTEAVAWQAIYSQNAYAEDYEQEAEPFTATAGEEEKWNHFWKRYSSQIMVLSVGVLLLVLAGFGILVYKMKKTVYD